MTYSIQTDEKTNITTITLVNGDLTASFLDFGARWHQFLAPDKNGKLENILLSLDTLEEVLVDQAQFGALVGPVAGRRIRAAAGRIGHPERGRHPMDHRDPRRRHLP